MATSTTSISPSDLRGAAEHLVAALAPTTDADWSAQVPGHEWTVRSTIEHLVDVLGFFAIHLAAGSLERLRFDVRSHDGLPNDDLLDLVHAQARALATIGELIDPDTRAFHPHGAADAAGFIAMACSELLVHGHDACSGLATAYQPRPDLAGRVLARVFPDAPSDADTWNSLLWATGRGALPGHPDVGSDWTYRATPQA